MISQLERAGRNRGRPALQDLLADIGKGEVDLVVVYKVDRLTRSLTDFARIIETFDARGAHMNDTPHGWAWRLHREALST